MAINEEPSIQRYQRISDIVHEPLEMFMSIDGYRQMPLVSLEEATVPLVSILPKVHDYVYMVKQRCPSKPADGLTPDESASIMIYSMQWIPYEECLYFVLNSTLRDQNREKLQPWFLYLKLLFTALSHIPSTNYFIYRGIHMDLSHQYPQGKIFVWWAFSSCTLSMKELENEHFLGKTGSRTIFMISTDNGKDISRQCYHQVDKEILLLAAQQFIVESCLRPAPDLCIIRMKEIQAPVSLPQSMTADSHSKKTSLTSTHLLNINADATWSQNGVTVAGNSRQGSGLNQLFSPYGLYVDDDQNVYVTDYHNHRIVEWKNGATSGRVVAGGNGRGNQNDQLNGPTDVILDKSSDSLIICDCSNKRVVRWPRQNGTTGETIISGIGCLGLAMDSYGYLYVSDYNKNEVRRWKIGERNGTVVAGGNGRGNRHDQLYGPNYIFIDQDQSVYASDGSNHRVMKWIKGAKEGIVVAGGQGAGKGLTQFYCPRGIVVDQLGTVYVADYSNNRVMRWLKGATQGSVVVGGNGSGAHPNQFANPWYLSFDRQGNLYVADFYNHRIQKFHIDSNSNL